MSENTCRICRTEATEDNPLFYPCKCRGSIKYIHQDCLFEWLNHSNKPPKCDICDTKYKFTTVYEENTPERVPASLILEQSFKFVKLIVSTALICTSFIVFQVIQVPVFFKFMTRFFTWLIDGVIPYEDSVLKSLLFGTYFLVKERKGIKIDDKMAFKDRLYLIFELNYVHSVAYMIFIVAIILLLFLTRELVSRDEGFEKYLNQKLGTPNYINGNALKAELLDAFYRLDLARNNRPEERNDPFMEFLRDVDVVDGFDGVEAAAARNVVREFQRREPPPDIELEAFDELHRQIELRGRHNNHVVRIHEEADEDEDEEILNEGDENVDDIDDDHENNDNNDDNNDNNVNNEENVFRVEGDNFRLQIGFGLSFLSTIKYAFYIDSSIVVFLFLAYFLPSFVFYKVVVRSINAELANLELLYWKAYYYAISQLAQIPYQQQFSKIMTDNFIGQSVLYLINVVLQLVILPLCKLALNIVSCKYPPTFLERFVIILIPYLLFGTTIYQFMTYYAKCNKGLVKRPLFKLKRHNYQIAKAIFKVFATMKVFLIFAIELVAFPIYCGILNDLVLSPLVLQEFKFQLVNFFNPNGEIKENVVQIFASNQLETIQLNFVQSDIFKVFYYWSIGTTYMCFLSLFVGMTRSQILRPGVLHFIRSPDDQNARLLHDALVKPLKLQISRIALSGLIYTIFIIVGIGFVTATLRVVLCDVFETRLLPMRLISTVSTFLFINPVLWRISVDSQLMTKYIRLYWKRAFRIACFQLRLSSFILDIDDTTERGRIVYRHWWYRYLGTHYVDYKDPRAESEIEEFFAENEDMNAVFIPDGNFVRAPDHETISKKRLKNLFVAVTKDDKLLFLNDEDEDKAEGDEDEALTNKSDSNDIESNESDIDDSNDALESSYAVVYRPPNFKLRVLILLLYVWFFATVLVVGTGSLALVLGRPVTKALCWCGTEKVGSKFVLPGAKEFCSNGEDSMDLASVMFGSFILLVSLNLYDKVSEMRRHARHGENSDSDEDIEEDWKVKLHLLVIKLKAKIIYFAKLGVSLSTSLILLAYFYLFEAIWCLFAHGICVDLSYRHWVGLSDNFVINKGSFAESLFLNYLTSSAHLVVGLFTIVPNLKICHAWLKSIVTDGLIESCSFNSLVQFFVMPTFEQIKVDGPIFFCVYLSNVVLLYSQSGSLDWDLWQVPQYHVPLTNLVLNPKSLALYSCSMGLLVSIICKTVNSWLHYYEFMNELVKNEVFGKSRRLENIDFANE